MWSWSWYRKNNDSDDYDDDDDDDDDDGGDDDDDENISDDDNDDLSDVLYTIEIDGANQVSHLVKKSEILVLQQGSNRLYVE